MIFGGLKCDLLGLKSDLWGAEKRSLGDLKVILEGPKSDLWGAD